MAIRVLVVDDSFFMRKLISDILNSDPDIEVVDTAANGEEAIKKVKVSRPEVITLDLVMPGAGGLEALKRIMSDCPTPVVMISAHTAKDAKATLECLNAGATAFVLKPSGEISIDLEKIKEELIEEVKKASKASIHKFKSIVARKRIKRFLELGAVVKERVIVIGSSTGGPPVLELILSELPANLPAAVLIVQHMPRLFTKYLAEHLDKVSDLEVKEAEEDDVIEAGKAYVAPGGFHMIVQKKKINGEMKAVIGLSQSHLVHNLRPSIDVTMKSVAEVYRENAVGIILTGMGNDGAAGMKAIKSRHGKTIAQDEATSLIFGMSKKVIENGYADYIIPMSHISQEIIQLVR